MPTSPVPPVTPSVGRSRQNPLRGLLHGRAAFCHISASSCRLSRRRVRHALPKLVVFERGELPFGGRRRKDIHFEAVVVAA